MTLVAVVGQGGTEVAHPEGRRVRSEDGRVVMTGHVELPAGVDPDPRARADPWDPGIYAPTVNTADRT